MRARRIGGGAFALAVVAAVAVATAAACNVWVSLENCKSSADCSTDLVCSSANICVLADSGVSADGSVDAPSMSDAGDADAVDAADAGEDVDAQSPIDAGPCNLTSPFGTPALVPGLESQEVFSARPSSDELTMFYAAINGPTGADIFYATRANVDAGFASGGLLPNVSSPSDEFWPSLTESGLLMFLESSRTLEPDEAGVYGTDRARIWSASRNDIHTDFDTPKIQSLFAQDSGVESAPYVHPSGKTLYFGSDARGGQGSFDIFVATFGSGGVVVSVDNVGANVNTSVEEMMPVVTADGLTLFFERPQTTGAVRDIWVSTRAHDTDAFGVPKLLSEIDTDLDEFPSAISEDGCRLYFISNRAVGPDAGTGSYRAWVASRAR
jgi:hypothetical protein